LPREAATFLLGQLDWIAHQQFADEANEQLRAAGAVIRRIVDAPAEQEVVGCCDCQAPTCTPARARATVTCEDCKACGRGEERAPICRRQLRGYLMTPSEAAGMLAFFGLAGDRNRCRKTIVMWAQRGRIQPHGEVDGGPAYRFGEILDRAAREAPAQAATA
jgi:hypothetical protein